MQTQITKHEERQLNTDIIDNLLLTITANIAASKKILQNEDQETYYFHLKKIFDIISQNLESLNGSFNIEDLKSNANYNEIGGIFLDLANKLGETSYNIGKEYYLKDQIEKALDYYENAISYGYNDFYLNFEVGEILTRQNNYDAALEFLNTAHEQKPKDEETCRLLGDIYSKGLSTVDKAIEFYEKYIKICDSNSTIFNALGHLYNKIGYTEKVFETYLKAIQLQPNNKSALSNLLLSALKSPNFSPQDIYKLTKEHVEEYLKLNNISAKYDFQNHDFSEGKKLHIGFLSGDFNNHAVMKFILPIFENYDNEKYQITCYSNNTINDTVTEQCKNLVTFFKSIQNLNDEELADEIFKDKVDILIDLSGHTKGTRIHTMGYKPAPIQVSYCGYPSTSGIPEIDFILTDKDTSNYDNPECQGEKAYYLENYECYKINYSKIGEITDLPYFTNNYITFGVFNCLSKINAECIKTWSKILKKIPDSKLFLHRQTLVGSAQKNIYNKFAEHNIAPNRLIFSNLPNIYKIMKTADIALDTFPYNGTTTTIDSILTGLPVICLNGDAPHSSSSARINKKLNLCEFIVSNQDEYIEIAVKLAQDTKKLNDLRHSIRTKFENSCLNDHKGFTQSFENALESMWKHKCKAQKSPS